MANRFIAVCSAVIAFGLAGCGSGADDGGGGGRTIGGDGLTAIGVFKDANVAGLAYTSGAQSGLTNANGAFTYEAGQTVTFRVGAVTIGTTSGKPVVTPLDLVSSGSSTSLEVLNRVRFLLLMDSDGNPANGITISEGLRSRAANWPAVDFASTDLAAALAATSIIGDTSVDGSIRALPSAAFAQQHLEGTVRCLYAGIFTGTYTGGDSGRWFLAIGPQGELGGFAYSTRDMQLMELSFPPPARLSVQQTVPLVAGLSGTGSSFNGQFTSLDNVSGNSTGGTFTGSRGAGTTTAKEKYLAILFRGSQTTVPVTFIHFEFDASDRLTARAAPDLLQSGQMVSVQITAVGNNITATLDSGYLAHVTLSRTTMQMTGDWGNGPDGGIVRGTGCRLN